MSQVFAPNPLVRTDSYKFTHYWQYPPGTQRVYSYLSARGGYFDQTQMVGTQYILKTMSGQYFDRDDIDYAKAFARDHFGTLEGTFHEDGWRALWRKHRGRLPLRVCAVPEGSVIPIRNVLLTVENTDPEFPWLTNWFETMLLRVWHPINVATLDFHLRQVIGKALVDTGDPEGIDYKMHDFGYRGVSSEESAGIGGFAHLVNFSGTDTCAGIELARQFYRGRGTMPGHSVKASEHSTITAWGRDHEVDAYVNMLDHAQDGIVACVSDSYDIRHAVEKIWGGLLRDRVMQRQGTVVVRPDSGDPVEVLHQVQEGLWERFGGTENTKGYRVLAPCVRVIWGDGISYFTVQKISAHMRHRGWSHDNWAYGMGGALLQQHNRDTQQMAIKTSAVQINGVWHDVWKAPIGDTAKHSLRGRVVLVKDAEGYRTVTQEEPWYGAHPMLQCLFEDGALVKEDSLESIRIRARLCDTYQPAQAAAA